MQIIKMNNKTSGFIDNITSTYKWNLQRIEMKIINGEEKLSFIETRLQSLYIVINK